ncbi:hypothetical protein FGO68_gene17493 [Halteria grandinella]|uniref:DUF218 domain-containing protein n=1 Tax=Halteria grandinella TaxID=5974 RepID=A0A8J8SYX7_HALGN|nr:hypothetical protein FGO68_gene17493 [Halteria grandinella]
MLNYNQVFALLSVLLTYLNLPIIYDNNPSENHLTQSAVFYPTSERVILHLGGNIDRLEVSIALALEFPDAVVVISTEGSQATVINRLDNAGISRSRYIMDFSAWDTVTNLATTYEFIKQEIGAKTVHIVTDTYFMRRSMLIARITYFLTGVKVIENEYTGSGLTTGESIWESVIDGMRALAFRSLKIIFYNSATFDAKRPAILASYQIAKNILGIGPSLRPPRGISE